MLEVRGRERTNSGLLYHDFRIANSQYSLAIRIDFSSQGGSLARSVRNVRPSLQGILPESYRECQEDSGAGQSEFGMKATLATPIRSTSSSQSHSLIFCSRKDFARS